MKLITHKPFRLGKKLSKFNRLNKKKIFSSVVMKKGILSQGHFQGHF